MENQAAEKPVFECVDYPRGNSLEIAGKKWIFAPMALGDLERYLPVLQEFKPTNMPELIEIAYRSLRRNYPNITREYVADELLDLGYVRPVLDIVSLSSGLLERQGNASVVVANEQEEKKL